MEKSGFSLVELSIVLVILGLLTGGVLTGQSLIRAAELRAITTELNQYRTAMNTFKGKYFQLPGAMTNATSFWGDNATHCADAAIADGTPGTCNGNGDGEITDAAASGQEGETFMFWQHMALAGMIAGDYTGLAGSGDEDHHVPGTNSPASDFPEGGWSVDDLFNISGNSYIYDTNRGNILQFGGAQSDDETNAPILTPEEAWNIDKKIDDGRPAYGQVIALYWDDLCAAANDGSEESDDFDADYKLSDDSKQCALTFSF